MSQRCGFLAYDWCLIFRIVIIFVFIFPNTSPWIIIIGGIEGAPWLIRAGTLQGADRIPSYQTTPYPNVWVLYIVHHHTHMTYTHRASNCQTILFLPNHVHWIVQCPYKSISHHRSLYHEKTPNHVPVQCTMRQRNVSGTQRQQSDRINLNSDKILGPAAAQKWCFRSRSGSRWTDDWWRMSCINALTHPRLQQRNASYSILSQRKYLVVRHHC